MTEPLFRPNCEDCCQRHATALSQAQADEQRAAMSSRAAWQHFDSVLKLLIMSRSCPGHLLDELDQHIARFLTYGQHIRLATDEEWNGKDCGCARRNPNECQCLGNCACHWRKTEETP